MFINVNDKQCKKHFPRLKTKASETKACLQAYVSLWRSKMDPNDTVHLWVQYALGASWNLEVLLKDCHDEWRLTPAQSVELWSQAKKYIVCNTALCAHFEKEGRQLFQTGTFKAHWMLHAVKLSIFINPRHTMCYSGESFMSVCKTLMRSCLKGRGVLQSMQKFMDRYIIALSLDMQKNSWQLR